MLFPSSRFKTSLLVIFAILAVQPVKPLIAKSKSEATQSMIKLIPGGAITLDLVLGLGYKRSTQMALVRSQKDLKGLALSQVRAQSGLSGSLESSLVYVDDQMARQPNFPAPLSNINQSFKTNFRKAFSGGQSIDAGLSFNHVNTQWPAAGAFGAQGATDSKYYETQYEVGVSQSLWKNSFGEATKASLQAARTRSNIIDANVESSIGDWGEQITEVFYNAWQAQKNVEAQKERLETQRRLEKITALSFKRGTVEKADLINVRSQVLKSEEAVSEAKKALEDTWRYLVVALNLPREFLQIDPLYVPIKTLDYKATASEICALPAGGSSDPSARVSALKQQIEAARLDLNAAKSMAAPDLYVRAALKSNAMLEGFGDSVGDGLATKNPQWLAMLGIKVDLGNDAAKAQIQKAASDLKQLNLQLVSLNDEIRVSLMNGCEELKRLDYFLNKQAKLIDMSLERQKLDEQRFRLGRIDVGQVIIAANDVITARFNFQLAQRSYATTVWSLLNIKGQLAGRMIAASKSPLLKGL